MSQEYHSAIDTIQSLIPGINYMTYEGNLKLCLAYSGEVIQKLAVNKAQHIHVFMY